MAISKMNCVMKIWGRAKMPTYLYFSTDSNLDANFEEDEDKKKFGVSRMPAHLRSKMRGVPVSPEERLKYQPAWVTSHKHRVILRKHYAQYGKMSGVDAGTLWPTTEDLEEMKEYEQLCYPEPLETMLENIANRKRLEKEQLETREKEVLANYAKLRSWIDEFQMRKEKKLAEALAQKKKKEKMIEEIRAFLGYQVDPRDERFQEILKDKEKEQKKAEKEAKKKEKIARELAKLKEQAEEEKKKSDPKLDDIKN